MVKVIVFALPLCFWEKVVDMSINKTDKAFATINDVLNRRKRQSYGNKEPIQSEHKPQHIPGPAHWLELNGATVIEPTKFEPDPNTYRGDYYYNTTTNRLYKKIVSRRDKKTGVVVAHWKGVSD
jgi:hypothetical protein